MEVFWLSGNCLDYPTIQLFSASEPIPSRSPHRQQKRLTTHPQQSGNTQQFHCSHTLNLPRFTRPSWLDHHTTSSSDSPSFLHPNFVAIRENKFGFSRDSNQDFISGSFRVNHHTIIYRRMANSRQATKLGILSVASPSSPPTHPPRPLVVAQLYNHHTASYDKVSNFTVDLLALPQSSTIAPTFNKVDTEDAIH